MAEVSEDDALDPEVRTSSAKWMRVSVEGDWSGLWDRKKRRALGLFSPTECTALRSLRSNPNLSIKPADKGGTVVVWHTDLYIAEARRQLSDTS
eukprot:g10333.t1